MFSSPGASEDKSVGGVDGGEDIRGEGGLDIPVGGQWSGAPVMWAIFRVEGRNIFFTFLIN